MSEDLGIISGDSLHNHPRAVKSDNKGKQGKAGVLHVQKVSEKYPTSECYHGGKLVPQTQLYFFFKRTSTDDWMRVDSASYFALQEKKAEMGSSAPFELKEEERQNDVCLCPNGYHGLHCEQPMYVKCLVTLTDPPTDKLCQKPDTDDFVHSIEGYNPCYFFDFHKKYQFKFKLDCRHLNSQGLVQVDPYAMGYKYLDVTKEAQFDKDRFDFSTNDDTKMRVLDSARLTVNVDFRDWKWMTQFTRFSTNVTDAAILKGQKEGVIDVDFSKMSASDADNQSKYEVAGRMYYELHAFGYMVSSFTSSGFLDREGYKTPHLESTLLDQAYEHRVAIVSALAFTWLLFFVFVGVCCCFCNKKSKGGDKKKVKSE